MCVASCYDGGDCCASTCIPSELYSCVQNDCMDSRAVDYSYYTCVNASGFISALNALVIDGICTSVAEFNRDFICNESNLWFDDISTQNGSVFI